MTNHQIGVALQRISQLLGSFAAHLLKSSDASPKHPMANVTTLSVVKAAKQHSAKPNGKAAAKPQLSKRHATIVAKFKKAGIKDPKLFTDIKTFDLWSKDGLVPKKGQHGIHGLFHRSQVQPIG